MPGVFVTGLRKGHVSQLSWLSVLLETVSCYVNHTDLKLVALLLPPLLRYQERKPEPLHLAYRNAFTPKSMNLAMVGTGNQFL